jgi:hypothetical protein
VKPTVVCLCGSTRFSKAFQEANLNETLAGRIVLTIGCDMRSDGELFAEKSPEELRQIKANLDALHLRKIDLADEVLILNVSGYIGKSTRRELNYARAQGKTIRFLEPDKAGTRFQKARYMQYYVRTLSVKYCEMARYLRTYTEWFTVTNRALVERKQAQS